MHNTYRFDCNKCNTKCDGISKGKYIFSNDVDFSEHYEKLLIKRIIEEGFWAEKCKEDGYPDVEIFQEKDRKVEAYIEVKVQRRAFMSVAKILPESDLLPSETLALNLSDLLRYFEISNFVNVPIYIMWVLAERPCVLDGKSVKVFCQNINELKKIYAYYGDKRRFRRKSGQGDVINGIHKGVVVNYHFSINELTPFTISNVIKK